MTETKDKLVTLEDLKTALDEENSSINDMTTGINLLRGTRDFDLGTEWVVSQGINDSYKDGFSFSTTSSNIKFSRDLDNFVSIELNNDVSNTEVYARSSAVFGIHSGDVYTIYGEFCLPDESKFPDGDVIYVTVRSPNKAALSGIYINYQGLGYNKTSLVSKTWYPFKFTYIIPSNVDETCFLRFGILAKGVGKIAFRKLGLVKGRINNPIWSPSPFDIDYINDETTGINLLRGTRDFRLGTKAVGNSSMFKFDGFYYLLDYWTINNEDGFFSSLSAETSISGALWLRGSSIERRHIGNYVTLSGEIKVNQTNGNNSVDFCRVMGLTSTGNESKKLMKKYSDANIDLSLIGKWQNFRCGYDISSIDDVYLVVDFIANNVSTNYSLRKLKIEEGSINNPIWSASPFDVASTTVEDSVPMYLGLPPADKQITSGDLNNIINPGSYVSTTLSNTANITNRPSGSSGAFTLDIRKTQGTRCIRQTYTDYNEEARQWIRFSDKGDGTDWTTWRQTYANTTVRPIVGGGTGATTAREANVNLFKDMYEYETDPGDASAIVFVDSGNSKERGTLVKRKASYLWNWIASKIRSVFGFTADNKLPASRIEGGGALPSYSSEVELYACTSNLEAKYESIEPIAKDAIEVLNNGVILSSDIYKVLSSKTAIMVVIILDEGHFDIKGSGSFMLGRYDIAKTTDSYVYAIPLPISPKDIKLSVSYSNIDNYDNGIKIDFYTNDGTRIDVSSEDDIAIEILV